MAKLFTKEFSARFSESDQAGVLFFAELPRIAHDLMEDALVAWDVPWRDWFEHPEWAAPIKSCHTEFKAPLFAGTAYEARVSMKVIDESSLRTDVHFFHQGKPCAEVQLTQVFIDRKARKKIQIPEKFRTLFA